MESTNGKGWHGAISGFVTESVRKRNTLDKYKDANLCERYQMLIRNGEFQDAISKRTTNMDKIKLRKKLAMQILYGETYE